MTVLLVLRENLADIDVVLGVARHREATLFVVHIELDGFLRKKK